MSHILQCSYTFGLFIYICIVSFPLVWSRFVFLITCAFVCACTKQKRKCDEKQSASGAFRYSRYSTCVSIHSSSPWLRRLMYKKVSSLWAACNSQYEFPNGHNGRQDHLLLVGGEVCIPLQLKRKTSRCLQRAVM